LTFINVTGDEEQAERENKSLVFQDPKETDYLVSNLGSHMGSLTNALEEIIMQKRTVEDVVASIVSQDIPVVASVLSGESCGGIDREVFILVSWCIFEKLLLSDQVGWENVYEVHPTLDRYEVQRAVRRLVFINVLSYIDWFNVCFYRRSMKVAFEKSHKHKPFIDTREVAERTAKKQTDAE